MVVQRKEHILDLILEHQDQLRQLGVNRLGLFGSFVRGQQAADSDVDALVEFQKDRKSFDNFMSIVFLLEDLLGRPVDLVTTEGLSPHIGPHILSEVEYVAFSS